MTRKKRRKPQATYTQLGVRLERYEVEAGVDVNFHLEHPGLAFHDADDDPLFEHVTTLVLIGTATYPWDRTGECFELTIRGDDSPAEGWIEAPRHAATRRQSRAPVPRVPRANVAGL